MTIKICYIEMKECREYVLVKNCVFTMQKDILSCLIFPMNLNITLLVLEWLHEQISLKSYHFIISSMLKCLSVVTLDLGIYDIGCPNDKSSLANIEGFQKSQQRHLTYVLFSVLILFKVYKRLKLFQMLISTFFIE